MDDNQEQPRQSLLPYDEWTEEALRQVVVRALDHAAREGLPGGHHFYVTFRTDHLGVEMPQRLREQYPQEMTIVIQHQFWGLRVDETAGAFNIGLSFGGVPSKLTIPFAAVTAFVDPEIRFGLRFGVVAAASQAAAGALVAQQPAETQPEPQPETAAAEPEAPQVVSLDAFRRRPPAKDS